MENPAIIRIASRRNLEARLRAPSRVVQKLVFLAPLLLVKGRIRHDEVSLEILVLIVGESVARSFAQIGADTSNCQMNIRSF